MLPISPAPMLALSPVPSTTLALPTPSAPLFPTTPINHPVSAHSTKIPVVVSFVAEVEYATLFAARMAVDERQILGDLGHPQPPTVISCDNECAIGLSNKTITPKMSKSLHMRLHWLRDRMTKGNSALYSFLGSGTWPTYSRSPCQSPATKFLLTTMT